MSENPILNAAIKLDPANEDHWTGQNLPAIDPLNEFLSEAGYEAVKRADVNEAIPEFVRPITEPTEGDDGSDEGSDDETDEVPEFIEGNTSGDLTEDEVAELREAMKAADAELGEIERDINNLREMSQKIRKSVHIMAAKLQKVTPNFSDLHRINRENQNKRIVAEEAKQAKLARLVETLEDKD